MLADGHQVTNSSVARALQRRGLLLPHGFRADGQSWAVRRRKVFRDYPPNATESGRPTSPEFETTNGGIWRICAVIDYVTKYNGHHRHPYQPQHRCAAVPATCRH